MKYVYFIVLCLWFACAQKCELKGAVAVDITLFPEGVARSCKLGFYCPFLNGTNTPSICPPSPPCVTDRLRRKFCKNQSEFEPQVCESGYYCPTVQESRKCPSGSYCPTGTYNPHSCPIMSKCPEGSSQAQFYGSIIFTLIVDLVLVSYIYVYRYFRKKKWSIKSLSSVGVAGKDVLMVKSSNQNVICPSPRPEPVKFSTREMCLGFEKARGIVKFMDFEFEDLTLEIPMKEGSKKVLSGVTGRIAPGMVTAILGPSGAGKSTFLNTLLGKVNNKWNRTGKLLINGHQQDLTIFRKLVGYVPQEDVMHRDLTVYQNIYYSATMRLPPTWTEKEVDEYVKTVTNCLHLSHVMHSPIGDENTRGVSGGERKRVNIGLELAGTPVAIFLDEPTSGLDATQALEVCHLLNSIAKSTGITVAMVIHQPRVEIWESLDNLLLLAPGGRTVYLGSQKVAQKYFTDVIGLTVKSHENPADAIMDCIAEKGEICVEKWKTDGKALYEKMYKEYMEKQPDENVGSPVVIIPTPSVNKLETQQAVDAVAHALKHEKRGASFIKQVWLSHKRSLWKQHEALGSLVLEIGVAMLAGLVIGVSGGMKYSGILVNPYSLLTPSPGEDLVPQMCLFTMMSIGLAASAAGVKVFGEEKIIYWRETAAGHNAFAYFLGNSTASIYRICLGALHFTTIDHVLATPIIGYEMLLVFVFGTYFAVYGQSCMIGMFLKREDAPLLAVVVSLFVAVFNGYVTALPVFLKKISYSYYATEAIYNEETKLFRHVYQVESISKDIWGYKLDWVGLDFLVLICLGIAYRFIAFILMVLLNRDKQK